VAADWLRLAKHVDAKGHVMNGKKRTSSGCPSCISKEFGKSVDWLLTGKAFVEPKKS
jgi:hypothetical protein